MSHISHCRSRSRQDDNAGRFPGAKHPASRGQHRSPRPAAAAPPRAEAAARRNGPAVLDGHSHPFDRRIPGASARCRETRRTTDRPSTAEKPPAIPSDTPPNEIETEREDTGQRTQRLARRAQGMASAPVAPSTSPTTRSPLDRPARTGRSTTMAAHRSPEATTIFRRVAALVPSTCTTFTPQPPTGIVKVRLGRLQHLKPLQDAPSGQPAATPSTNHAIGSETAVSPHQNPVPPEPLHCHIRPFDVIAINNADQASRHTADQPTPSRRSAEPTGFPTPHDIAPHTRRRPRR